MSCCKICGTNIENCVSFVPPSSCFSMALGTDVDVDCVLTDARGEPIDLQLDVVTLTVRDKIGGAIKIQKSNGIGAHLDPINGRTLFEVAAGDITDTPTGRIWYWVFEVRRIAASGEEAIHIAGDWFVNPSVGG